MSAKSTNSYTLQPWSLDDLFPAIDSEAVETAVADLEDLTTIFEAFQPQLNDDISQTSFQAILDAFEQIVRQLDLLSGYAYLCFAADTQDQQAQNLMARSNQIRAVSCS